ncbi:hypothetical protein MMPV_002944 [Pyropia vietnamensis]
MRVPPLPWRCRGHPALPSPAAVAPTVAAATTTITTPTSQATYLTTATYDTGLAVDTSFAATPTAEDGAAFAIGSGMHLQLPLLSTVAAPQVTFGMAASGSRGRRRSGTGVASRTAETVPTNRGATVAAPRGASKSSSGVKVSAPSGDTVSRVEAGASAGGSPPRRRGRPNNQKTVNTTARRRRRLATVPRKRRGAAPSQSKTAAAAAATAAGVAKPGALRGAASPLPVLTPEETDDVPSGETKPNGPAWRKDALSVYLSEIRSHELLGRSEEVRLATEVADLAAIERIKASLVAQRGRTPTAPEWAAAAGMTVGELQGTLQRGVRAKNALVSANMRLVASIVRKMINSRGGRGARNTTTAATSSLSEEDMIQEGCLGLIRAAELYDPNRGFHFSTYATWWVRAVVQRALAVKGRMIHVPNGLLTLATKIRKTHSELAAASPTGDVTDDEVAAAVGITPAKLKFVNQVSGRFPSSLDATVGGTGSNGSASGDDSSVRLAEILEGDDNVEAKMVEAMQREELDRILRETLRPQERAVVRLRFGLDDGQARTLTEIGALLAVSKERVRRIVLTSLSKLKTPGVKEVLQNCIGSAA